MQRYTVSGFREWEEPTMGVANNSAELWRVGRRNCSKSLKFVEV